MKYKIIILTLLLFLLPLAFSQVQFYDGSIEVKSLEAEIDGSVALEYVLVNNGDKEESVSLSYLNIGNLPEEDITLQPGKEKTIQATYDIEITGEDYKTLKFNPVILFNGMYHSKTTGNYYVKLVLPEGVEEIVSSSKEHDNITEDGAYIWNKKDIHPTALNVRWSELDADIEVTRTATPTTITWTPPEIQITATIKNNGVEEIKDITLEDSFTHGIFKGVSPIKEFEYFDGGRVLQWEKKIKSLKPGEEKTLQYTVKIEKGMNIKLNSLRVMVDDSLVAITDEIPIAIDLCGNGKCDYEFTFETELNCIADCPKSSIDGYCADASNIIDPDCTAPKEAPKEKNNAWKPILAIIILVIIVILVVRKIRIKR